MMKRRNFSEKSGSRLADRASARSRAREWFGGLDFVGRDEFEAVKAMAAAARDEADALRARLDAMTAGGAASTGAQPSAAATPPSPAAPSTLGVEPDVEA